MNTLARTGGAVVGLALLGLAEMGCQSGSDGQEHEGAPAADPFADCVHPSVLESCVDGWCRILAGCFVMGSPEAEWGRGLNDEDLVAVTLTRPFAIMQHEVTQGEWLEAGLPLPPTFAISDMDCTEPDCPIEHVTWFEAAAYANLRSGSHDPPLAACYELGDCYRNVGEEMGCETARTTAPTVYDCEGFRLPTEAEWEYAARGGTRTAFYSGDITPQPNRGTCYLEPNLEEVAWYCNNSGDTTHPVGRQRANGWGLHDVLGNTSEWTSDYPEAAHAPGPLVDPAGTIEDVAGRVTKGGSAVLWSSLLRAASRGESSWTYAGTGTGLRLVRTLPPDEAP